MQTLAKRTKTNLIVVHCSATKAAMDIGVKEIRDWHTARGFADIGYHFVIRRIGTIEVGREYDAIGAHCQGNNRNSIGICLVGGLDANGKPENNYTILQLRALDTLLQHLLKQHPEATIVGHRDLSPDANGDGIVDRRDWLKDCPCFDVRKWWNSSDKFAMKKQGE